MTERLPASERRARDAHPIAFRAPAKGLAITAVDPLAGPAALQHLARRRPAPTAR